MDIYELTDLSEFLNAAVNTQARFDANWAIFLSINSAIIGTVVIIKRVFSILEKMFIVLSYSILTGFSFIVASNTGFQLKAIYSDLAKITFEPDKPGYHTVSHFKEILSGDAFWANAMFIPGIYSIAYIFVVLAILFEDKFTFKEDS